MVKYKTSTNHFRLIEYLKLYSCSDKLPFLFSEVTKCSVLLKKDYQIDPPYTLYQNLRCSPGCSVRTYRSFSVIISKTSGSQTF